MTNHYNLSLNINIAYIYILYDRLREMVKNTMGTKLPRKLEQEMESINHHLPTIQILYASESLDNLLY